MKEKKIQKKFDKKINKITKLTGKFLEDLNEITPKDTSVDFGFSEFLVEEETGVIAIELTFDIPLAKIKVG